MMTKRKFLLNETNEQAFIQVTNHIFPTLKYGNWLSIKFHERINVVLRI